MMRSLVSFALLLLLIFNTEASAKKRALLIGYSDYNWMNPADSSAAEEYPWKRIDGVKADHPKIKEVLARDFLVETIDDSVKSKTDFVKRWRSFVRSIDRNDEVLVYFAGHGIDISGANYLIPLDARAPDGDEEPKDIVANLISLRTLVEEVQEQSPFFSFFVIDACRTDPFKAGRSEEGGGLAPEIISRPRRYVGYTVILFSADFNEVALDTIPGQPRGSGSPFAREFTSRYTAGSTLPVFNFVQEVAYGVKDLVHPRSQLPNFQGMPPPRWCIATCNQAVTNVLYANAAGTRIAIEQPALMMQRDGANDAPRDRVTDKTQGLPRTLVSLAQVGNVVFVGRASKEDCKGDEASGDIPFGCEFLKTASSLARADGNAPGKLDSVSARVNVFVRRDPPTILEGKAKFDCPVRVLKPGDAIQFKGVTAYQYIGDTFYWGVVDAPKATACMGET